MDPFNKLIGEGLGIALNRIYKKTYSSTPLFAGRRDLTDSIAEQAGSNKGTAYFSLTQIVAGHARLTDEWTGRLKTAVENRAAKNCRLAQLFQQTLRELAAAVPARATKASKPERISRQSRAAGKLCQMLDLTDQEITGLCSAPDSIRAAIYFINVQEKLPSNIRKKIDRALSAGVTKKLLISAFLDLG